MLTFGAKKIVNKPWGREIILEINDKYCFKQIEINKGNVTSLQYHEYKKETICLILGKATLIYVNDGLEVKKTLKKGECFTVNQYDIHRMVAETDIVFLEASTPEVWDVVRLEDSYGREGTDEP